jgi:hypothetical protein
VLPALAICKHEQKMGMVFVARSSTGHVIASFCATKPFIVDIGIAEAISARKMIEVIFSLNFQIVLFERGFSGNRASLEAGRSLLGSIWSSC